MEIVVLGSGCSRCKALHATVLAVVEELKLNANVVKQEDMMEIMKYNVMTLPALVVDGKVVGKGPMKTDEVRKVLQECAQ